MGAASGAAGVWGLAFLAGLTGTFAVTWVAELRSARAFQNCLFVFLFFFHAERRSGRLGLGVAGGLTGGRSFWQARGLLAMGRALLRSAARVGVGSQQRRADTSVSVFDSSADGEAQLGELSHCGEHVRRSLPLFLFLWENLGAAQMLLGVVAHGDLRYRRRQL
ncbi:hypothetical protein NDU88_007420 [Pleurodeles waltl]|uniref:Uncharacterized protein n=1 Tax=Pleurodeles waltl TaxID=8319 RepID=A0AAV7PQ56_PLEWA|nr:hypothetical protein NDU88_007420 [Pleurodeles waltl]